MNNYLLPSILAPSHLTWCHSLLCTGESNKSTPSSFSVICYFFPSHIFCRLTSPSLLSLSLRRSHSRPHSPSLHLYQFLFKMRDQICTHYSRCEQTVVSYNDTPMFFIYFVPSTLDFGKEVISVLTTLQWWADDFITLRFCSRAVTINPRTLRDAYEVQIIFPRTCITTFTYTEPAG